ncbi:MAG: phosphoribosylformylglycinamidine synthase subunit PurQ [Myxococcales bacterium]|nr:phosphoribosylformylglycinamidine synthase subunit PurQ [Myxococcales bacterium]
MIAYVVTGYGLNCEEETAHAYRAVGMEARIVHAQDLFAGDVSLTGASVVHLSGGFSFGDDLGSGKVFANRVRLERRPSGSTLLDELAAFVTDGGFLVGICNGFQILVKSGILPNVGQAHDLEVTLTHNDSGHFEDRWVRCRGLASPSPAFADGDLLDLPVRHAEGKLVTRDARVREAILEKRLVALAYVDAELRPAHAYPENPNGSELACAGLTDPTGRVLGMMPHPEAFLLPHLHPGWAERARAGALPERGDGLSIFENIARAADPQRRKKETSLS